MRTILKILFWANSLLLVLAILLVVLLWTYTAKADTSDAITVMVIDTGVNFTNSDLLKYSDNRNTAADSIDVIGHGTLVADIITNGTCDRVKIISCKYFDLMSETTASIDTEIKCLNKASRLKVDIVHFSSGGPTSNTTERYAIERYINGGGVMVVAAGNNGLDLDEQEHLHPGISYYPASYKIRNLYAVGAIDQYNKRWPYSNYGSNIQYEVVPRHGICGTGPINQYFCLTGTSVAAPVLTNRLLKSLCGAK